MKFIEGARVKTVEVDEPSSDWTEAGTSKTVVERGLRRWCCNE